MRKDYEMDEENLQEAEDEFYNYYHGEKKKTNTVPVVIALLQSCPWPGLS